MRTKPLVIIKIGTNILTTDENKLDLNNMRSLVDQISAQLNTYRIVMVSSGAVTCGSEELEIRAKTIPDKQAAAAVGQIMLMSEYTTFFKLHGKTVGQILLTKDILIDQVRRTNSCNTIFKLLEMGAVPIINENDSVATDEIRFGDNDELSAMVAQLTQAERLIILTDIDGVFTGNPKHNKKAALVQKLEKINEKTFALIEDSDNGKSRGGMKSKLMAAKEASEAGIDVTIANGRRNHIIRDVLTGKATATYIQRHAHD